MPPLPALLRAPRASRRVHHVGERGIPPLATTAGPGAARVGRRARRAAGAARAAGPASYPGSPPRLRAQCFGRLCVYRFSVYAMLALRLCQGIAALISFWIMAAAPANAVKDLYEFRLLTTVGVMIFIWSVLQVLYRGGKEFGVPIPDRREAIKLLEAVLELGPQPPPQPLPPLCAADTANLRAVLLILTFSAAVASAYRLNADNTVRCVSLPLSRARAPAAHSRFRSTSALLAP